MRRLLAGLLVTLTLLSATLSLTAAVLSRTLGDPTRPGRILAALLESPDGRDVVADLAARASGREGAEREQVRAAARRALENEQVREQTAALTTPRARVSNPPSASSPRSGALEQAVRTELAKQNPELAKQLSSTPLPLALPRANAGPLAGLRTLLDRILPYTLLAAALGALTALLISPARPSVLRRFSSWGFKASVVQVIVCYVLPRYILPEASSSYLRALGVVIEAATAALVPLFLLTLAAAVGCALGARALEAASRLSPRGPRSSDRSDAPRAPRAPRTPSETAPAPAPAHPTSAAHPASPANPTKVLRRPPVEFRPSLVLPPEEIASQRRDRWTRIVQAASASQSPDPAPRSLRS